MKIVCDACSAKYSIADEKVAGKVFKIRCKKCSNVIVVRGAQDTEAASAPEQLEQKETRVFDYSGYDNPQDAVAAAESSVADGGVWHVVIDQEQVGPMTPDEVRQRFAAGDIDVESFIWREGFADWERLDALAEFSDLAMGQIGNGANVDDAAAAMFGGPALDEGGSPSDPADLFTAQAGASDVGGGLFGGGADDGGLFGGAADVGMSAAPAASAAPIDDRMTGERNENSVLFSLNNLASLASDAPKSAPMASSGGGGGGGGGTGMAQSGGQEGSGLIDIRAMASMYVGGSDGPAAGGVGSIDDLPVFSQPAIASASPVLMPVAAPANSNKLLVALIAGIGALLLVAVLLVVLVLKGGDDNKGTSTAANNADGDGTAKAAGIGDGDGDGDSKGSGSAEQPPKDGTTDGSATGAATGVDDAAAKAKAAEEEAAAKAEREAKKEAARLAREERLKNETPRQRKARLAKEKKDKEKAEKRREAARAKREAAAAAAAAKRNNTSSSKGGCDELTCLVEPNKACCKKRGSSNNSKATTNSGAPERPSKSQIKSGMGRASGSVKACGRKANFSGRVKVKIRVSAGGRVSSASASGGPGKVNSCAASAVKRSAKFPKTAKGFSFSYSYRM